MSKTGMMMYQEVYTVPSAPKAKPRTVKAKPDHNYRTATHYTLPDEPYKGNYACLNGSAHLIRTDNINEVSCVKCLEAIKKRKESICGLHESSED